MKKKAAGMVRKARYFLLRSCEWKAAYASYEAAVLRVAELRRAGVNHEGALMRVYECTLCGQFHVGHRKSATAGK